MRNETERSYLELVELAMSVVLRWEISGTVKFINEYGAELFGYRKEELVGRNIMGTIVDETESTGRNLRTMIEEIVTQPEKYRDNENENVTKDGKRLWMHWRNTAVLDRAGRLTEIISIGNDITGRRQAEEALKVSEARYHSILDDQTELICRYRHDGRISFVNGAYARYYGKRPEELLGRNYIPHIPEPDLSKVLEEVREISPETPIRELVHRVIMPDGTVRWQQWTHRGIFAEDGIVIEYQAVGRDITKQKQTEEELAKYRLHLEEMVEERTKNLEEAISSLTNEIDRRKEVEAALERNRLLLSGVFNSIQDGIAVVDRDQNIIMANRALQKLFPNSGSIGFKTKKCFELYRNAAERCEDCSTIRAIEGQTPQVEIIPFSRDGSETGWLEVLVFPFWDEHGRIRGVIQCLRDITERRRIEENLVESEQRYRDLFQKANEGIFLLDKNGDILAMNESYAHMHGYSVEEMQNMKLADMDIRLDSDVHAERTHRMMQHGSIVFEVEHRHKAGHTIDVEVSANYIELSGEEVFLCFHKDVTERKQAEKELREQEGKLRAMIESFDGFIYICSEDHRIEFMNENLMRRTGKNAVGDLCYSVLHGLDSICPWCVNDRIFKGEIVRWEIQSPKDGCWYYVVNTPIRHADGSFSKQAMILDITEKKKLEERARINSHLAVLGQLSAGIAHEINNPNAFIMSNAQILQDIWRDAELVLAEQLRQRGDFSLGGLRFSDMCSHVQKAIQYMIEGSDRINNIVTSLKQYTSPLREYVLEQLDINEILRYSCLILENKIKAATDNFSWIPDETIPALNGNRQALEQVVMNLITNALQALTNRTEAVYISTRYDGEKNEVIIEVRDEGIGMTQEVLDNAMNPFYTTKRNKSGVGLGLAIALSIVNNHNGSLGFESEPGKGTTATVRLPGLRASGNKPGAELHA